MVVLLTYLLSVFPHKLERGHICPGLPPHYSPEPASQQADSTTTENQGFVNILFRIWITCASGSLLQCQQLRALSADIFTILGEQ